MCIFFIHIHICFYIFIFNNLLQQSAREIAREKLVECENINSSTRYEARYQAEADRKHLHVPSADQVLVLARGLVHEAEVDADHAAGGQHRGEHGVIQRAEILHRFTDLLYGGPFRRPIGQA